MHELDQLVNDNASVPASPRKGLWSQMFSAQVPLPSSDYRIQLEKKVEVCSSVFKLFGTGTLILDEVDMILHPLKVC